MNLFTFVIYSLILGLITLLIVATLIGIIDYLQNKYPYQFEWAVNFLLLWIIFTAFCGAIILGVVIIGPP